MSFSHAGATASAAASAGSTGQTARAVSAQSTGGEPKPVPAGAPAASASSGATMTAGSVAGSGGAAARVLAPSSGATGAEQSPEGAANGTSRSRRRRRSSASRSRNRSKSAASRRSLLWRLAEHSFQETGISSIQFIGRSQLEAAAKAREKSRVPTHEPKQATPPKAILPPPPPVRLPAGVPPPPARPPPRADLANATPALEVKAAPPHLPSKSFGAPSKSSGALIETSSRRKPLRPRSARRTCRQLPPRGRVGVHSPGVRCASYVGSRSVVCWARAEWHGLTAKVASSALSITAASDASFDEHVRLEISGASCCTESPPRQLGWEEPRRRTFSRALARGSAENCAEFRRALARASASPIEWRSVLCSIVFAVPTLMCFFSERSSLQGTAEKLRRV